jgi:AcrR family transcriptional regulator
MRKRDVESERELIIRAAVDVFADVEYEKAAMRQICQKSGKSPTVVYKHFTGKEQILVAVTCETLKQFVLDMNNDLRYLQGTYNKFKLLTYSYLKLNERFPRIAWLIYVSTNVKTWFDDPIAWQGTTGTGNILKNIILDGQKTADIRKDINLHTVNHLYFGGLRSIIVNWLLNEKKWSLVDEADDFTNMIYDTIKQVPDQSNKFICPFYTSSRKGYKKPS